MRGGGDPLTTSGVWTPSHTRFGGGDTQGGGMSGLSGMNLDPTSWLFKYQPMALYKDGNTDLHGTQTRLSRTFAQEITIVLASENLVLK